MLIILLATGPLGRAAPLLQGRSIITYPTGEMTVSAQVQVRGIATHPNMNFYQVRYAAGSEPTAGSQWVDFAVVEGTQVEDGVLGTWDTTAIPDGQYTLALAVWGFDDPSNPYVFFVTHVAVNNTNPVPTATPPESTPEPMPTAVVGVTPTPVSVEQPPTATPRPSRTPGSGIDEQPQAPSTGEGERPSVAVDFGELRAAFWSGVLVTLVLFLLWGLYLLLKVGVRWVLRQQRPHPPLE